VLLRVEIHKRVLERRATVLIIVLVGTLSLIAIPAFALLWETASTAISSGAIREQGHLFCEWGDLSGLAHRLGFDDYTLLGGGSHQGLGAGAPLHRADLSGLGFEGGSGLCRASCRPSYAAAERGLGGAYLGRLFTYLSVFRNSLLGTCTAAVGRGVDLAYRPSYTAAEGGLGDSYLVRVFTYLSAFGHGLLGTHTAAFGGRVDLLCRPSYTAAERGLGGPHLDRLSTVISVYNHDLIGRYKTSVGGGTDLVCRSYSNEKTGAVVLEYAPVIPGIER